MRDLKQYLWIVPSIGMILCFIAFLTPTAYFENTFWNHTIYSWIWGYFYERQSVTILSTFYTYPLQLIPSIITSVIIITCILIVLISTYRSKKNEKQGKVRPAHSVVPAIFIIITIITWMITMEIAEFQLYDISFWDRYLPSFGLIGMFLGAGLTIIGFFMFKKYYVTR